MFELEAVYNKLNLWLNIDLVNVLITIAVVTVVYLAWISTNVRENHINTQVFIVENRQRLLDNIVRLSSQLVRRVPHQSHNSISTDEIAVGISTGDDLQSLVDELTLEEIEEDSASESVPNIEIQYRSAAEENINNYEQSNSGSGPQDIINDMDNSDANLVRRRTYTTAERNRALYTDSIADNSHAENCSNENNENESISEVDKIVLREQNVHEGDCSGSEGELRIKIKYLNDELRLVKGKPTESIGEFKRRNFTLEYSAQKLVRLVFKGHVLQPDSKTLQACGLFDNCVVHCLIHNKRSTPASQDGRLVPQNEDDALHPNSLERSNNGRFFVYFGLILISIVIGFCWYCRIEFNYLFSWYSTFGLVFITIIFLVMFPLLILIEREVRMPIS